MPESRAYLFDAPGIYRIRIQGRLNVRRSGILGCMTCFTCQIRRNPPTTTTLTGMLVDQAGLISVLTELYDMGYPLLEVKRLPDRPAGGPAASRPVEAEPGAGETTA
jgi:hypothetical protein